MLIEGATTRLGIDLLESLRKHKFEATQIRVSYITHNNTTTFKTFENLDSLITFYTKKYGRIVVAKTDPFTNDPAKAQMTPIIKDGLIIGKEPIILNKGGTDGLCELGLFLSIESFKLKSSTFNYELEFNCFDVSDNLQIRKIVTHDNRRNINRNKGALRQKDPIIKFIKTYQIILDKLYINFNANLYVDLCYIKVGYVKDSIKLYSLFFALVKEDIKSGLRLSVLKPRYLKK